MDLIIHSVRLSTSNGAQLRGSFERLVDTQQCAAVMQKEAVTCEIVVVGVKL
jgi:hypothetical protein